MVLCQVVKIRCFTRSEAPNLSAVDHHSFGQKNLANKFCKKLSSLFIEFLLPDMQQRGVITTAVILALILAGALWYTLTRNNSSQPEVTPTPSPVAIASPTPASDVPAISIATPDVLPATTTESTSVSASAPTGPAENIVVGLAAITLVGLWQLSENLRRA